MINVKPKMALQGFQTAIYNIGVLPSRHSVIMEGVVKKCGQLILDRSQVYVPVLTGKLKASGHLETYGSGFRMVVHVIYDVPYAVYVHENTNAYHAPPTSAKFLTLALSETKAERERLFRYNYQVHTGAF
jgi:hypothetical protein